MSAKISHAALPFVLSLIALAWLPAAGESSPYGICAHVSRHGDHELAREEFAMMRQAGIQWARTDFDWTSVQHKEGGPWDFTLLDETVEAAEAAGIEILPILAYDVPWASPAYRHLDAWREYVRQTVGRYHDRLRYWEVWNEPDLEQFWKETPDPANYVTLLKAACEEIRAIDPDLRVLLGGVSGIPYEYIEGIYEAGGRDCFDVMAVHPYRYPQTPEAGSLRADLEKLRGLMEHYGDGDKPVWITEIGWPTHRAGGAWLDDIIRAGLKAADPDRSEWTLAVLDDPSYRVSNRLSDERLKAALPGEGRVVRMDLEQVRRLSPRRQPALLMPPDEAFPVDCFDAVEAYVRDGGIVIFTQGVPLYYTARRASDGSWQLEDAGPSYRRRLRIGWEAWWTREGVPKEAPELSVAEPFAASIRLGDYSRPADRFLTDSQLKPGDRFIPLVRARKGDYTAPAAAVFDLDSDMKGAVIVSTLRQDFRGVSEERQAAILPRAYLIALHSGVERMFWYNLRAREEDPFYNESHFGIVHRDLSPKPAYRAFQALNQARPAGSVPLGETWQQSDILFPGWQRPDGKAAFAIWTVGPARELAVSIDGPVDRAFDHLGKPVRVEVQNGTARLPVSDAPLYLVGPSAVQVDAP